MCGIGAVRTRDVIANAEDAQELVPWHCCLPPFPTTGSPTTRSRPVPRRRLGILGAVSVYDTPGTTGFSFTDELLERIAGSPGSVASRFPGPRPEPWHRAAELRGIFSPDRVHRHQRGLGGGRGLAGGLWRVAFGRCRNLPALRPGTRPRPPWRATQAPHGRTSRRSDPIWPLFKTHGSSSRGCGHRGGTGNHWCLWSSAPAAGPRRGSPFGGPGRPGAHRPGRLSTLPAAGAPRWITP